MVIAPQVYPLARPRERSSNRSAVISLAIGSAAAMNTADSPKRMISCA